MRFNQEVSRQMLAEGIGTFMLVLIGAGASVLAGTTVLGSLIPALAHGLALIAIIGTYGYISGAHVNPAVTLAVWIGGHIETPKMVLYWIAQFIGGFLAAGVLLIILPDPGQLGQTALAAGSNNNELDIILVEGILTFILVGSVYQAAIYHRGGPATPIIIGMTLAACILLGQPITGAGLNPARTLPTALLADETQDIMELLIYLVAQFGGAALGAVLHMDTFKHEEEDASPAGKRFRRNK